MPIDPPICCMVLTRADATPESSGSHFGGGHVDGWAEGEPEAQAENDQRRQDGGDVTGVHVQAAQQEHADRTEQHPGATSGRGPSLGSSLTLDAADAITVAAVSGKNARPVVIGL